ncbi:SH3 domain-containing protein [Tepidimonas ignava]
MVNLRAGPGTDTEVRWQLRQGYPLQVLQRQRSWLQDRGGRRSALAGR